MIDNQRSFKRCGDCASRTICSSVIHALVDDGVFLPSGAFRVLPPLPEAALRGALRNKSLDFLCSEGVLDTGLAERMVQWRHSGFSLHNRIRSNADDAKGRQRLARYMIRCPFALEKMRYDDISGTVIYRSRLHATLKRNYQLMPPFWREYGFPPRCRPVGYKDFRCDR